MVVMTLAIVRFIIGVWGPMRDISRYRGEEVKGEHVIL
jgi:hypothetical protein